MKKLVFAGCSFTAGSGWKEDISKKIFAKNSEHLWTNLCHKNLKRFSSLEQVNVGLPAASNTDIFTNAVKIIGQEYNTIDTMFCQWTAMPRYNFNIGFELWNTTENFLTHERSHDVNLNRGDHWSREYINDLMNRIKVLHHLHWEILKVVEYSNIILNLSRALNFKVFFINGLCPWDQDYFIELVNVKPESYTPFTKREILNIDTRDDDDIYALYSLAHQHYKNAGGVNESDWINLYNSMASQKIDVNFDNKHPGIKSNESYYQMIRQRLQELNFI